MSEENIFKGLSENLENSLRVSNDTVEQLGESLSDMLVLIEEHGSAVMKAHASRILKARESQDVYNKYVRKLEEQNAEMMAALFFHPRAAKLMRKRKNFVAIAEDEPYFIRAYSLIRENEIIKDTWSDTDEGLFQEALAKVQK